MIVLDASAALELLLQTPSAAAIRSRLAGEQVYAPHLIDLEVMQVLRRHAAAGVPDARLQQSIAEWKANSIRRYPHEPYLDRIWALRTNFSAYDAAYIALAEALSAPLLTHDAKLASPGHTAVVEVV